MELLRPTSCLPRCTSLQTISMIRLRRARARVWSKSRQHKWLALKRRNLALQWRRSPDRQSNWRIWAIKREARKHLRVPILTPRPRIWVHQLLRSLSSLSRKRASRRSLHPMFRIMLHRVNHISSVIIVAFKVMDKRLPISISRLNNHQLRSIVQKSKKLPTMIWSPATRLQQSKVAKQTLHPPARVSPWPSNFCTTQRSLSTTNKSTSWTNQRHRAVSVTLVWMHHVIKSPSCLWTALVDRHPSSLKCSPCHNLSSTTKLTCLGPAIYPPKCSHLIHRPMLSRA